MKSVMDILPALYAESDASDGSLAAFVTAMDESRRTLITSIVQLGGLALAPTTQDSFLVEVATRYGNPFKFLSAERLKQDSVLENLVSVYSKRGSRVGIVATIYYLCGVSATLVEYFEYGWILGTSKLGVDTCLADSASPAFWVRIPSSTTTAVKDEIATIVNFMKPASSQWRFILT
jgi:phage tail-like protein